MSKVRDLNKAKAENADAKTWVCMTCDTMVVPGHDYCPACTQYWVDVAQGVFDDPDY